MRDDRPRHPAAGRPRRRRATRLRASRGARSWGSPRSASTATPTASPTRRPRGSAGSCMPTARCARCMSWRPARFEIELDPPGERHSFTAYTVGAANSGLRRRHARRAGRDARRRPARGGRARERQQAQLPDEDPAQGVQRDARRASPACSVFRAREVAISADRPFTMYADGDPIGELPVRVRALRGAVTMLVPRTRELGRIRLAPALSATGRARASPRAPRTAADGGHARPEARARAGRRRALAPARRRRHERAGQGADAPGARRDRRRSARACRRAAC